MHAADGSVLSILLPTSRVGYVRGDAIRRPTQTGPESFEGGDERGRAWVFSPKKGAIVCAGTFESTTPRDVLVHFFGATDHEGQVDSSLMLALRKHSIRAAVLGLVAVGPPK